MRYIYYVVAALIFLAVVNLASRFIGNDTQELLTDLNPDQQVTEAANPAILESATPPVVSLNANQTQAVEQVETQAVVTSEPAETSTPVTKVTAITESDVESGTTEQPSAEAAKNTEQVVQQAAQSLQSEVVTAAEASPADVSAALAELEPVLEPKLVTQNPVQKIAENVESAATAVKDETPVQAVVEITSEAVAKTTIEVTEAAPTVVNDIPSEAVATTTANAGTDAAEILAPDTQTTTSQATTAIAAAVATTVAANLATTASAPESTQAVAPAIQTATATPDTTAAITAIASEPEKLVETSEPSLIQSLGDSAGSAATAVVGGAQQAVETVVEAARSLINTDDTTVTNDKTSEVVTTAAEAGAAQSDPAVTLATITDTADTQPAATTTEPISEIASKAVAEPSQESQAPTENTPAPAATVAQTPAQPAATPVAKPVGPRVGARGRANSAPRNLSTAPSEVLELVNQHPGKVLMIGFFSPNCWDCKPSLAWLNEMRRKYWSQGLQVIGVNLGTQAQAKVYLQDSPVSFEILHDPERKLASAFWLAQQPSTYLVNGSGKLLSTHQGHSQSRIGEYEDAIRTALEQR